jgi:hypothetical protein
VTVVDLPTNGNTDVPTRERVRQAREQLGGNPSGAEIARLTEIPETTVNYHLRKLGNTNGKVPATPPTTPRKRVTSTPAIVEEARRDPWQVAITSVVLLVCIAVSAYHIVDLALLAGAGWWAWALPVPLDGMVAAAARTWHKKGRYWVAGAAGLGAFGLSAAANAFAERPEFVYLPDVRLVASLMFPVGVLVCVHLLDRSAR